MGLRVFMLAVAVPVSVCTQQSQPARITDRGLWEKTQVHLPGYPAQPVPLRRCPAGIFQIASWIAHTFSRCLGTGACISGSGDLTLRIPDHRNPGGRRVAAPSCPGVRSAGSWI